MSVRRVCILGGAITLLFLLLAARTAMLQLFPDRSLEEAAFRQKVSGMGIERIRGNILDRNNIPFTNRETKYMALVKTPLMPQSGSEREKVFEAMGVDMPDSLTPKSRPLLLKISEDGRDALKKAAPDWISIIASLERYGEDSLARHAIGYLNRSDQVGMSGIEKAYEKILRDNKVFEIGTVTDAAREPIKRFGFRLKDWSSGSGFNVKLTLDYHVQKIVEDAMDNYGLSGAVVVEDVVTGDILAMASRPHFDQDAVEKYLDSSGSELFNKATAAYNLGSVFKIIDLAAFFENEEDIMTEDAEENAGGDGADFGETGMSDTYKFFDGFSYGPVPFADPLDITAGAGRYVFTDPDHYYCSGAVDINGHTFRCHTYYEGGHGSLDLERAFALSCNSYFIEFGQKIGYRRLVDMAQKFGLGCRTGISEQGVAEAPGNLPDINAYHSRADIANIAIGQGPILATPVQVADLTATVANGGIRNRVNIVDSIVDENGRVVEKIKVSEGSRIISKETSDRIREMMEAVTVSGTGTEAAIGYYGGAGGKTGSAETGSGNVVHAWFAGYFPAADPRYSVAVFAEDGRLGGKSAAPVFAEIAKGMLEKGY